MRAAVEVAAPHVVVDLHQVVGVAVGNQHVGLGSGGFIVAVLELGVGLQRQVVAAQVGDVVQALAIFGHGGDNGCRGIFVPSPADLGGIAGLVAAEDAEVVAALAVDHGIDDADTLRGVDDGNVLRADACHVLAVAQIDVADERLVVLGVGHLCQRLNLGGHVGDVTVQVLLLSEDSGVFKQHVLKPLLEGLVALLAVHAVLVLCQIAVNQLVEGHQVGLAVEVDEGDVVDDVRLRESEARGEAPLPLCAGGLILSRVVFDGDLGLRVVNQAVLRACTRAGLAHLVEHALQGLKRAVSMAAAAHAGLEVETVVVAALCRSLLRLGGGIDIDVDEERAAVGGLKRHAGTVG